MIEWGEACEINASSGQLGQSAAELCPTMLAKARTEAEGCIGRCVGRVTARENFVTAFEFAAVSQIHFDRDRHAGCAACLNAYAKACWGLGEFGDLIERAYLRLLALRSKRAPIGGRDALRGLERLVVTRFQALPQNITLALPFDLRRAELSFAEKRAGKADPFDDCAAVASSEESRLPGEDRGALRAAPETHNTERIHLARVIIGRSDE